MGRLRLRNCTRFKLAYWRVILLARTNYVAPGDEGHYDWGATYTLKAEIDGKEKSCGQRAAVNQSGVYYAYYSGKMIQIYSSEQFEACAANEDNPFVTHWKPEHILQVDNFKVDWKLIKSIENTSDIDVKQEWTETMGFENVVSKTMTVTDSESTEVSLGTSFEVKGISMEGSVSTRTERETFTEHVSTQQVYGNLTKTQSFTIESGQSLAIWQAYINVWGHEMFLDHVAYYNVGSAKPTDPKFDRVSLTYITP